MILTNVYMASHASFSLTIFCRGLKLRTNVTCSLSSSDRLIVGYIFPEFVLEYSSLCREVATFTVEKCIWFTLQIVQHCKLYIGSHKLKGLLINYWESGGATKRVASPPPPSRQGKMFHVPLRVETFCTPPPIQYG